MLSAIREVKFWTWEMCALASPVTRAGSVKLVVRVTRAHVYVPHTAPNDAVATG